MKNNKAYIIGLFLIFWMAINFSSKTHGQSLPKPSIHWTFDYNDALYHQRLTFQPKDGDGNVLHYYDGNCAMRAPSIASQDAHGYENSHTAYRLEGDEYFKIVSTTNQCSFFGLSNNNEVDAFTLTLWVKMTSESAEERILFGAKYREDDVDVKFGLSLIGQTLYLKQYFEEWWRDDRSKTVSRPWKYRLLEPAAFDAGPGWYYVCAVFAKTQKYMRVFVGKPGDGTEYGYGTNKVRRKFDGRLIWIPGIREGLPDFSEWVIGPADGLVFSDMKIYHYALDLLEARNIYYEEHDEPGNMRNSSKTASLESKEDLSEEINPGTLKVYPNPTDGEAYIEFPNPKNTTYQLQVVHAGTSSVVYSNDKVSGNRVIIDRKYIQSSGLYIIILRGEQTYKAKLIVK
ncbi:hypothetical protein [Marinifilum caeruleilacunae]|uniref:T9SS type A sorting domain-containing protein n=1 Tax=Marinifilum caeruleilacunae TaxID=2499076 RepID=A0ABX1WRL5_9BACT|nr:hypothetical protein [Marinifilum caeruleilacunae]NOU58712.1 hypothetical protein [Marinifilum caeruleilacunae]